MNIFLFEEDLEANASYFKSKDPKRFNKQIVESTQLLAASMLKWHNVTLYKKDGSPYVVNRILHHPACKFLLSDIDNHYWHIDYLESLLKLAPSHACNESFRGAIDKIAEARKVSVKPKEYLCLTNSDMSGLEERPTVFARYRRHLQNKLSGGPSGHVQRSA